MWFWKLRSFVNRLGIEGGHWCGSIPSEGLRTSDPWYNSQFKTECLGEGTGQMEVWVLGFTGWRTEGCSSSEVCVCVCACVHMCTHKCLLSIHTCIHTHTDTQRYTHTEGERVPPFLWVWWESLADWVVSTVIEERSLQFSHLYMSVFSRNSVHLLDSLIQSTLYLN